MRSEVDPQYDAYLIYDCGVGPDIEGLPSLYMDYRDGKRCFLNFHTKEARDAGLIELEKIMREIAN